MDNRLIQVKSIAYRRMLQREHSAILSTIIKLPFVIKIFVLSIFEWPLKPGFTVVHLNLAFLLTFLCHKNKVKCLIQCSPFIILCLGP